VRDVDPFFKGRKVDHGAAVSLLGLLKGCTGSR
jgi:hypothetical protein